MALLAIITLGLNAQNSGQARKVLDQTARKLTAQGGASADFRISGTGISPQSGTLSIKGNKFCARAGAAIVWYNGKTQWSYLRQTNEVNVTTPTEAQRMRMNPYTFITMYKSGYTLSLTTKGGSQVVHMKAQNPRRTVQEVYITVDKATHVPSIIRMREGSKWTTISISRFRNRRLPDSMFAFSAKDFPTAEVIDLR